MSQAQRGEPPGDAQHGRASRLRRQGLQLGSGVQGWALDPGRSGLGFGTAAQNF